MEVVAAAVIGKYSTMGSREIVVVVYEVCRGGKGGGGRGGGGGAF